jgi:hypothetical protein
MTGRQRDIEKERYWQQTIHDAAIRQGCAKWPQSRDAAPVRNAAPVEAQTAKPTYGFLSEPMGGHARRDVGGRIRRLTGDEAAHPS